MENCNFDYDLAIYGERYGRLGWPVWSHVMGLCDEMTGLDDRFGHECDILVMLWS